LRGFINEARTLAQFSHPALLRVYRFWEANSTAYMATQLYKGRTLGSYLDETSTPLPEAWLRSMIGPLLGALEMLHADGCCHRDIAPDNIFIQNDGNPVLLDFGAARKSIADMVDEVAVMVKSGYSPIEQYADDGTLQQGPWTDLYALGAVLYRAVTGAPPVSAVVRSVEDSHVMLDVLEHKDLSAEFCAAVNRSLMVNASDRPQSVAEFARMLDMTRMGDIYIDQRAAWTPADYDMASTVSASSATVPPESSVFNPITQPLPDDSAQRASLVHGERRSGAGVTDQRRRDRITVYASLITLAAAVAIGGIGWWTLAAKKSDDVRVPVTTALIQTPPPTPETAALPPSPAAADVVVADTTPEGALTQPIAASEPIAEQPPSSVTATADPPANPDPVMAEGESIESDPTSPPDTARMPSSEDRDWQQALTVGTRTAYRAYLKTYPRGSHARQARAAITELNRQAQTQAALNKRATNESPGAAEATGSSGHVTFNVRPWGQIFVDGKSRGISPPLKSLSLPRGVHAVEIRNGDLPVYRARVVIADRLTAPTISHEFK
jgi:non-specific serine/threonine protein kinase